MKRYILAGILVMLVVLVTTFPARVAYRWIAPPDVQMSGISGSIWNGRAGEVLASGAYIQELTWKLKPKSLFSGLPAFEISGSPALGTMNADVAVGFDGSLTLRDLAGNVPLDLAHPAFQQNGISGDVSLQFASLVLINGIPTEANGSVSVANLFVPNMSATQLGDFRADLQTTDEGIVGELDDTSGVIDLDAATIVILPDGRYRLTGNVATRPGSPPSIEQQLRGLGIPDERGMREFRVEGQF